MYIPSMALVPFLADVFQDPVFSTASAAATLGIGVFHGVVLGRAILLRFPRLQNHLKTVSISLFVLFLANAVLSVPRFASPEKIDLATVFQTDTPGEFASVLFLIFGVNTGFLTVLAISVTIVTFVLLKVTNIRGVYRWFVFLFSALILLLTGMSRFTDLTPSTYEVILYFLYQLGLTVGILFGSIRKIRPKKPDMK